MKFLIDRCAGPCLAGGCASRDTTMIITLFLGLFFLTAGLDEIANPRLRREV